MSRWLDDNEDDLEQIVVELQHAATKNTPIDETLAAMCRATRIAVRLSVPPSARAKRHREHQ